MKDYLLVPMQPTPNGQLHIGHIAGPYLRADAVCRNLRRSGVDVQVITGSDVFENWVLLESVTSGTSPMEICFRYHELIHQDLAHVEIFVDEWINPLDREHIEPYLTVHEEIVAELVRAGRLRVCTEKIPIAKGTSREVVGVWLTGRCPSCHRPCSGNSCVFCGSHFQPDEVLDPRSRLNEGELQWLPKESIFAQPVSTNDVLSYIEGLSLSPHFSEAAESYVARNGGRIRLSQPGTWGLSSCLAPRGSVLVNTYFAYSFYCAQRWGAQRNVGVNALSADSAVEVVSFFGRDNSIAGLVAPPVISLGTDRYKPFDFCVMNDMLYFEGRKCSTSKKHGILVSDILDEASLSSDELRYYLAHLRLESGICDSRVADIVRGVNRLRAWQRGKLSEVLEKAPTDAAVYLPDTLFGALSAQYEALTPPSVYLARAAAELDNWLYDVSVRTNEPSDAFSWLMGVALLSEPILPRLASELWSGLGLPGRPSVTRIPAVVYPRFPSMPTVLGDLTDRAIWRCARISEEA